MNASRLLIFIFIGLTISACSASGPKPIEPAAENLPVSQQPTGARSEVTAEDPLTLDSDDRDLEIITLLPQDAIPAIDNPEFLPATAADDEYAPEELIIGVIFDGDARAYSISFLSRHEIVNDTVGGVALSVTW